MCKTYLTQIKDLRLRLEGCENRTVTRLRQAVDKEPLKACAMKTAEQMVTTMRGKKLRFKTRTLVRMTKERDCVSLLFD